MNIYNDIPRLVLGFHGCTAEVRDKVLKSTNEHLKFSTNDYDWLGSGIYFWLNDPQRALEWASKKDNPAVIGAIIDLGVCLNLSERTSIKALQFAYTKLKESGIVGLKNKAPDAGGFNLLRPLDCAVINYSYHLSSKEGMPFDTVMGIFQEGTKAFEGSDILEKTHTQICVRNTDCIKGYFLPREFQQ